MDIPFNITKVSKEEYPVILAVWEASVRATHDFLKPGEIERLKPLILNQYLAMVTLACIRNEGDKIEGFVGVAEDKVEMLFVHPAAMGMGIGRALMEYAIHCLGVKKVDVNEDNGQAVAFYKYLGFEVAHRSPLDGEGNPYPILHLQYRN
ncbi:GNAT family N-acetyltransferase [Echinicola strongylocentroti]|uniref:GNAT family N-acetyltransferase n=1 Tax=Echinicola strongylocentroti TaxID=1795355 RepID=A0A2Z4IKF6_9BACT|nr:GNAT family N-acetyltransferase [Echinicola strongylocentroti]AWW31612.1 GNAT family N-acetyltransferase [Echinicola strongylocentroti]